MRFGFALAAVAAAMSLAGPALAATVNATSGQVLLNRGEGYRLITGSTHGDPGNTVVANPGGSGQIVYDDGCVEDVLPGSAVTIAAESPCKSGLLGLNGTTYAIGAVIVGGGIGAAILLGKKDGSSSP